MRSGFSDDDEDSLHLSEIESIDDVYLPDSQFIGGVDGDAEHNSPDDSFTRHVAKRDYRAVFMLKLSVVGLLFLAAIALSVACYFVTTKEESDDFIAEYDGYAKKVVDAFHEYSALRVWTAQTVSAAFTADFGGSGDWPFVTMTEFSRRTVGLSYIAKFSSITFAPLVTNETRAAWELYAIENQYLPTDSVDVEVDDTGFEHVQTADGEVTEIEEDAIVGGEEALLEYCGDNFVPSSIEDGITTFVDHCVVRSAPDGPGPFFPAWEMAPYDSQRMLVDLASLQFIKDQIHDVIDHGQPSLSRISVVPGSTEHPPLSTLLFPVFSDFNTNSTVVGIISLSFDWSTFFSDILPPNAVGIYAVLKNTCGQAFSFELNGPDVVFLGEGDMHDREYDDHRLECGFETPGRQGLGPSYREAIPHFSEVNESKSEYQPPDSRRRRRKLDNAVGACKYSIFVYPSNSLKTQYSSNNPAIYTTSIALIFVFAISAFLAYDYLVERRLKLVLKSAARANAVVHALFPPLVRERVYQDSQNNDAAPTSFSRTWGMQRLRQRSEHTIKSGTVAPSESAHGMAMQSISSSLQESRDDDTAGGKRSLLSILAETPKIRLKSYLIDTPSSVGAAVEFDSEPIAEMFTDTTIMFADIAGFTAWSSEREPSQVFILLETLYRAFDAVAHRLGVFKVETIGDCYVAVTGLPDPNKHHAVVMTYFAYECIRQMKELVRELEASLGPGTSDLTLRVGVHSGPVTAGVLRGEKSRFQLFGDSVNVAARMESTGITNMIHASQETADLLVGAGKVSWVATREDVVFVKGKGEMQTFWLKPRRGSSRGSQSYLMDNSSCASSTIDSHPKGRAILPYANRSAMLPKIPAATPQEIEEGTAIPPLTNAHVDAKKWGNLSLDEALTTKSSVSSQKRATQKRSRLVDWNVDLLLSFLAKVVANRNDKNVTKQRCDDLDDDQLQNEKSLRILDEVTEIILIPGFDSEKRARHSQNDVILPPEVRELLHDYVTRIASMYREHPFHNLEHASHVTMSAVKLMRRIINPDDVDFESSSASVKKSEETKESERKARRKANTSLYKNLHDSTFGISSDPLTQFCVVFSALIHDVDHAGVPNSQLVKEGDAVAIKFGEKSSAEQNSVYIAWEMLMEPKYEVLRTCIYTNGEERQRFRQLVVNAVMATDIMDRELQSVRKNRWDKAFCENDVNGASVDESITHVDQSRKATSVIEHIIQASDVAHTMQHWHIFRRWNERLFDEQYIAYKMGRSDGDPSIGWYQGQIGFFDHYIIPLAKKLNECGVFGVAGSEYLSYALENRREWEIKGEEESEVMLVNFNLRHGFWSERQLLEGVNMIPENEPFPEIPLKG